MNALDTAISKLQQDLPEASDFSSLASDFLTITETTNLTEISKISKNDAVSGLVLGVVKQFLPDVRISKSQPLLMLHYPKFDFFHGSVLHVQQSFPGAVFFIFRRQRMGLISLQGLTPGDPAMMHYCRFRFQMMAGGEFTFSLN